MPRYSESRVKFPVHMEFQLTREQNRRALALAQHDKVSRSEAIRRALDARYLVIFPENASDQIVQSGAQP